MMLQPVANLRQVEVGKENPTLLRLTQGSEYHNFRATGWFWYSSSSLRSVPALGPIAVAKSGE